MPEINVSSFSISDETVTLLTTSAHNLSEGDYFSLRNLPSGLNGEYNVLDVQSATSLRFFLQGSSNTPSTSASGKIIYATLNNSAKVAYMYDTESDSWILMGAKSDTGANYNWTGSHVFQGPVTLQDALIEETLVVTSASALNISGSANITGDTFIDGELTVNNNSVLDGSVDIKGNLFLANNVLAEGIKIFVGNSGSPTGNPDGGGFIYVENGALKYMGASGTITTIALA
jgi:hypothetical protein